MLNRTSEGGHGRQVATAMTNEPKWLQAGAEIAAQPTNNDTVCQGSFSEMQRADDMNPQICKDDDRLDDPHNSGSCTRVGRGFSAGVGVEPQYME